jgi:hypothetical protein
MSYIPLGQVALTALVAFSSLVADARGSRKPVEKSPAPVVRQNVLKKLVAVESVNSNSLMGSDDDNARFALLLGEQFSHHLVASESFITTPLEADEAQFELDVSLIGFEAISSKGVKFGFSPTKNFLPIGLEFSIQAKSLLATFRIAARDPLTNRVLASVVSSATLTDKKKFFSLRYLDFVNASFESSKKTPLAALTGSALKSGVLKLQEALERYPWEGRLRAVFMNGTTAVAKINGGHDLGLKEGMRFTVVGASDASQGRTKNVIEVYRVELGSAWAQGILVEVSPVALEVGDRVILQGGFDDQTVPRH